MCSEKIVRHPYRSKQTKTRIADSTLQIQIAEEDDTASDSIPTPVKLPDDDALAERIDKLKKHSVNKPAKS